MTFLGYIAYVSLAFVLLAEAKRLLTTKPPYFEQMIEYINSQNASWRAGETHIPNLSWNDMAFLTGSTLTEPKDIANYVTYQIQDLKDMPESFDAREKWQGFIHPIRDQGKCGSCWAFGAVEAMSDRLSIFSNGTVNVTLSAEQLVSCAPFPNLGCQGGQPFFAWRYLKNTGVVSELCDPYTAGTSSVAPSCKRSFRKKDCFVYKLTTFYKVGSRIFGTAQNDIKKEILENGPVEAVFRVHSDFLVYKSGVYEHLSGSMLGGHAVKILGWGVENGIPYWLVANSWGLEWGEDGYFKIKRGVNECGIESMIYAGIPNAESVSFSEADSETSLK